MLQEYSSSGDRRVLGLSMRWDERDGEGNSTHTVRSRLLGREVSVRCPVLTYRSADQSVGHVSVPKKVVFLFTFHLKPLHQPIQTCVLEIAT